MKVTVFRYCLLYLVFQMRFFGYIYQIKIERFEILTMYDLNTMKNRQSHYVSFCWNVTRLFVSILRYLINTCDGKHIKYKSHNYATSSNQNRRFKANAVESDMCYVIFLDTQSHWLSVLTLWRHCERYMSFSSPLLFIYLSGCSNYGRICKMM